MEKKLSKTGQVIHRDLAATAVPLITDDWGATFVDASELRPDQHSYRATSDQLIEELQSADTVVIAAPMDNFSIPAPRKAWVDQVVRMGKTFGYRPNGPQGSREQRISWSSPPVEACTRRALREERSIFKSLISSTFQDSSALLTSLLSTRKTRAADKPNGRSSRDASARIRIFGWLCWRRECGRRARDQYARRLSNLQDHPLLPLPHRR
jgi:hypothetical protein